MAINGQGSSITSVTNVGDNIVDHEQFMLDKYHIEHNQGSLPQEPTPQQVQQQVTPIPVTEDAKLSKANKKDLKSRNLNP
jgi:hypothetical protein